MTDEAAHRLGRIESILREYGMHEPSCPAREIEKANQMGGVYWHPRPCACWLTDDNAERERN